MLLVVVDWYQLCIKVNLPLSHCWVMMGKVFIPLKAANNFSLFLHCRAMMKGFSFPCAVFYDRDNVIPLFTDGCKRYYFCNIVAVLRPSLMLIKDALHVSPPPFWYIFLLMIPIKDLLTATRSGKARNALQSTSKED